MWILIIITSVLVAFFLIGRNSIKSFTNKKISLNGGMLTVYKDLVDGLLEDPDARILRVDNNSINLGVSNIDGSTIFRIVQLYDNVTVAWKVTSQTYGNHTLRWEFPNGLNQNKMVSTITAHIEKYNQTQISELATAFTEIIHEDSSNVPKIENLFNIDTSSDEDISLTKKVYFNKMVELNPSALDLVDLFYHLSKSMFDEAKNGKLRPKDTPSGILYEWTYDYGQYKKIATHAFSISHLSDLYDSDPSSMIELIESKRIIDNRKFKKL